MQTLRNKINERLDQLNFEQLWTGFKRYDFALYNEKTVYFEHHEIPIDHRFKANTTIQYDNHYIAIWRLDQTENIDIDILTANLVHEMYHAHQMTLAETRCYSDLEGLKAPRLLANFNLKHLEYKTLIQAVQTECLTEKATIFNDFISTRKHRKKLIGTYMDYENAMETIEGCAEYITLSVLKMINPAVYEKQKEVMCDRLMDLGDSLFDVRRMAYDSGAIICLLASELNMDVLKPIGQNHQYIFDQLPLNKKNKEIILPRNSVSQIQTNYKTYIKKLELEVNRVISNRKTSENTGEFEFRGYDPMNMVRFEDKILHKSFVGISSDGDVRFLEGPVVTIIEDEDYSKFTKYYTV